MKRKVRFLGNPFWECRVKRFRGCWGCIKKQVTTSFYDKPADEVIKKFKTQRESSIFADMVNVRYSPIILNWEEKEGVESLIACKSLNARHRLNEILFLKCSGYELKDIVFNRCFCLGLYFSHKELSPESLPLDVDKLLEEYKQGCAS